MPNPTELLAKSFLGGTSIPTIRQYRKKACKTLHLSQGQIWNISMLGEAKEFQEAVSLRSVAKLSGLTSRLHWSGCGRGGGKWRTNRALRFQLALNSHK